MSGAAPDPLTAPVPEITRCWERANAAMPPADPFNPDDPSTALATLAAIAHAKWVKAELLEAEREPLVEIARAARALGYHRQGPALRAALARLDKDAA